MKEIIGDCCPKRSRAIIWSLERVNYMTVYFVPYTVCQCLYNTLCCNKVSYFRPPLSLQETRGKLGSVPSRTVRFFSFSQDRDSVLNTDEGRRRLRDMGIGSPQDVGDWLVEVFRKDFRLEALADRLDSFIHTE